MKKYWRQMIPGLLCFALVLGMAACAPSEQPTEPTGTTGTTQIETTAPSGATELSGTEPDETDTTVTDPTVTGPTVTDPTVTDPAMTDPTVTDPTVTVPSVTTPVVVPAPTDPKPTEPKPTDPEPTEPAPTEPEKLIDIDSDRLPCSQEELYRKLFDPNRKIEVDIRMDEAELQKIQDDYEHYTSFGSKSPIYRMADMVITIDGVSYLIREVGVRMKGNTSRTDFYDPDEGIYNAIHLKLDFQQTFDDEAYYGSDAKVWSSKDLRKIRKNRTFATLEELELRWNKSYDPSYIRESYAHELYDSEGVLTPLINLCSFDWSGVHMGVYTVNEPVDKIFLEKRLPSQDLGGDLYKCSRKSSFTSTGSIGIEDEDKGEFYAYDLKTNKKTSDHSSLKNLIQRLNADDLTKIEFSQLVDVDNFLSYAAVSWFLGNPDDLRNNYNNFYLYFLKSSGKAIIIPYDIDQCLGITYGEQMSQYDPFSDVAEYTKGKTAQENPLFLNTVVRGSFYADDYADALERVRGNELLESSTFKQWFDRAESLYGGDVEPSKTMKNMERRDLSFDMYRTSKSKMPFDTYLAGILDTYEKYMEEYRGKQI